MEIMDHSYKAHLGSRAEFDDHAGVSQARGDTENLLGMEARVDWSGADDEDACDACCCREDGEDFCCSCGGGSTGSDACFSTGKNGSRDTSIGQLLLSRPGRLLIFFTSMIIIYFIYLALALTGETDGFGEEGAVPAVRTDINSTRARDILTELCSAYERQEVAGDACERLCFHRDWQITDFYESNKVVIMVKDGGQTNIFKSTHPFIGDYAPPDERWSEKEFIHQVRERANTETALGWPADLSHHLLRALWPSRARAGGASLSKADRRSLWALIQQPEFVMFRLLPLSRVTPKVIGSCGHLYHSESLVAFRMKGYYVNLKGKILVHLMGTLKLFYEFLNEPLQWCDVRFENLGLSADYPKRFVMMDGDLLYTESRLKNLLTAKSCTSDEDCTIGDCTSRCQADLKCSPRTNENLDVFCEKLINKLFGSNWSKSNKYLLACHDTSSNFTQKLNDLRLTWSWTLSDV